VPRDGDVVVIFNMGGTGSSITGSISGTALTVTAGTVAVNDYIVGSGVAGCSADPTTCPTVVSGSAPNWVLSASGGTVAPGTVMAAGLPTVCSIPSSVGNNVDMAGVAGSMAMNSSFGSLADTVGC
jgi:hypothetical protein